MIDLTETRTCTICGKKPSKFQCDFPKRYLHVKIESKELKETREITHLQTCDRYVCEDCVVRMGDGIEICKECKKELMTNSWKQISPLSAGR